MEGDTQVFVGIDVAKLRNAIAVADAGRDGEIRFLGEVDAGDESMRRVIRKIASGKKAHFCYEACGSARNIDPLIRGIWSMFRAG